MSYSEDHGAFSVHSDEAVVVSGRVKCWNCRADIEVIGVYCQSGFVRGEPMLGFSVVNITDVDDSLAGQLARWPLFHLSRSRVGSDDAFGNHCSHCSAIQDDFDLHCQPQGIFFNFQDTAAQALTVHALNGLVRLSGDEGSEY